MNLLDLLYMSKAQAIEHGFESHGSIYGIPAYLKYEMHEGEEYIITCTKIPLLQYVTRVIDYLFEAFSAFLPEDMEVETPHTIKGPLKENKS